MVRKKNERGPDREITPALLFLRGKELGLSISELDEITEGMVLDLLAEKSNDEWYRKNKITYRANQEDFDKF